MAISKAAIVIGGPKDGTAVLCNDAPGNATIALDRSPVLGAADRNRGQERIGASPWP
jgi:hypothetical protein